MNFSKKQKIVSVVVIVGALIGVYFLIKGKSNTVVQNNNQNATTTTANGITIGAQGTGNYKIEQVPVNEGRGLLQPVPDLNRSITFLASLNLSQDTKNLITAKITDLQAKLKLDQTQIPAWVDLGMYQKMAGDYQGTILSWQYAFKLNTKNYVPLGDLGDLYAYYIKDKNQAVSYYNQAITVGSDMSYLYIQLADVYKNVFNDLNKAKNIIDQGLSKIPNDPALLQYKQNL